jgi:hypothetical protein
VEAFHARFGPPARVRSIRVSPLKRHPVDGAEDNEEMDREKLKREIHLFDAINDAGVSTLKSKTMSDDDRVALKRQIAIRMAHQKLLQQRLNRLSRPGTLSAY